MRCLIFGGSGFLGSHLVEELLATKHKVLNFDLNSFPNDSQRYSEFIANIEDAIYVRKVVDDFVPEYVYIFSAVHDIESCEEDPYSTFCVNILGLINILDAILPLDNKTLTPKVIFASSMYANSAEHPYGITKLAGELMLKWYAKKYNFPYVILRFGTVYGPRAGENNGLRNFVRDTLEKGVIEHYGTGKEVREYIHVKDVARACIDLSTEENETFVITGATSIKSGELCSLLQEMLSGDHPIDFRREVKQDGHYEATPYRYKNEAVKKYSPTKAIDFCSGLLELIEELKGE